MSGTTLVAGVGNVFLGDDGFGGEVARRLADHELPPGTRVVDYGIRGIHLAYDLLEDVDTLVLVDTLPGPGAPGELTVLEVDASTEAGDAVAVDVDAHGMDPAAVLALLRRLGGTPPRTFVVGVVAADVGEGIGLSPVVAAAVDAAVDAVHALLAPPGAGSVGPPRAAGRDS